MFHSIFENVHISSLRGYTREQPFSVTLQKSQEFKETILTSSEAVLDYYSTDYFF